MMHAMHVGVTGRAAAHVEPDRRRDIGVVEHRGRVERPRIRAPPLQEFEREHHCDLDRKRDQDFSG
jgi:hypothetical protein